MSLYSNAQAYADETFITIDQAEIRCKHFRKLKEVIHQAKKCPTCGAHTLDMEGGSYEENIQPYVYCENDQVKATDEDGEDVFTDCGFTSEVTPAFEALHDWYDFDEVLAFAYEIKESRMNIADTIHGCSWHDFVENANRELVEADNGNATDGQRIINGLLFTGANA